MRIQRDEIEAAHAAGYLYDNEVTFLMQLANGIFDPSEKQQAWVDRITTRIKQQRKVTGSLAYHVQASQPVAVINDAGEIKRVSQAAYRKIQRSRSKDWTHINSTLGQIRLTRRTGP